jgi:hypothetical protein
VWWGRSLTLLTSGPLLALALALAVPARAAETAAEPSAEALAAAWFEQRFGENAVEVWSTDWAAQTLIYGVARRWTAGNAEVLLRVLKPHQYEELGFLMRRVAEDSRLQVVYYRTPKLFPGGRKAARVMPIAKPDLIERLPFVAGLPVIGTVYPARVEDFTFQRLPDQDVSGQPCRRIEGRMKSPEETWDSFVAALSRDSGVALDTQWQRRGKLVRRVSTAPEDVKDFDGRAMPARIVVEIPGQESQEFRLLRLRIDPAMPDQLFDDSNLKTGRFPSY